MAYTRVPDGRLVGRRHSLSLEVVKEEWGEHSELTFEVTVSVRSWLAAMTTS